MAALAAAAAHHLMGRIQKIEGRKFLQVRIIYNLVGEVLEMTE